MHGRVILASCCSLVLVIAGCSGSGRRHSSVRMSVSPMTGRLDTMLTVRLSALASGSIVVVGASAVDSGGTTWSAQARYRVPSGGALSLAQPAIAGSYTGSDAMGLLLSMRPEGRQPRPGAFVPPARGYRVQFIARVGGAVVASAQAVRAAPSGSVRDTPLRPKSDGIYGDLLTPTGMTGRRPAVLLFGGSEGGEGTAKYAGSLLAADGYPVLTLAYFAEPGLPRQLLDVPLEYFQKALTLLRGQPHVDPRHVLLYGSSRGGELALLLAATYPDQVNGVIAGSATATVHGSADGSNAAAWTLHGAPLTPGQPIPVEEIHGPVVLACGGMDYLWPSCSSDAEISARLHARHFRYPVTSLSYPHAGHLVGALTCCTSIYDPADQYGGTVDGNDLGQVAGHQALLTFLASQ